MKRLWDFLWGRNRTLAERLQVLTILILAVLANIQAREIGHLKATVSALVELQGKVVEAQVKTVRLIEKRLP